MSIESNKAVVSAHFEKFNAGDLDGCVALIAEDVVNHSAIPEAQGRRGARGIVGKLRAAFPDMHLAVEDMIAEGDRVVCRLTVTGTHEGDLDFVKRPLPATGKRFRTSSVHMFRIAGGAIVERWVLRDDITMYRQLGVDILAGDG